MLGERGYHKAIELLHQAATPNGFIASVDEHDNYKRVWTRDGVVNGLAALMSEDDALIQTFRNTLVTIFNHQHPVGFMPSNVTVEGQASYGGTAGRADNPSWAVIGLCAYTAATQDFSLLEKYQDRVHQCLAVMEAWEFNGKHLMYVPQSGDWADEYIQHGYILFDQLLRVWALRLAGIMFSQPEWTEKAENISGVIVQNYWNGPDSSALYAPNLHHQRMSAPKDYWFLGFNPARIYSQFDLQANSLALLLDIGGPEQDRVVIEYLRKQHIGSGKSIVPSFYPSIKDSDWEMRELETNYAYSFRNAPGEFHNGGLWPVWNGFLVAALMKKKEDVMAKEVETQLHLLNAKNDWEINECFHGLNFHPSGVPRCTWSAGGAVIAFQAIRGKRLLSALELL